MFYLDLGLVQYASLHYWLNTVIKKKKSYSFTTIPHFHEQVNVLK